MKKGWEIKTLGEVCEYQRGLTYAKSDEVDFSKNVVLRATNIDLASNHLIFDELKYINDNIVIPDTKRVKKSSLLICTASGSKSHLGKVAFIDDDYGYAYGGFMGMLTPCDRILPRYLFHLMTSEDYKNFIGALSDGTNINNLTFDNLKRFPTPIPPLDEQQRIVRLLDEAFEGIAIAKANTEKNVQNARAIFESHLQAVFTHRGEGWVEKKLCDVCSLITDGKHGDCRNEADSGYYFLSAKDVQQDTLIFENARQIKKQDFEETHRRTNLMPNDICMVNTGATIGKLALAPGDPRTYKTTFQKSVAVIKPISSIINYTFCYYHLKADLSKLLGASSGSAQKNLLLGDLRIHPIVVPSMREQSSIATMFDALSEETQRLTRIYEQKLAALEALKKSLLHQAFSGAL